MEGGGKHPAPVLHQPKKPGANRVKRDFLSSVSLVAGEIFANEKCSNMFFPLQDPWTNFLLAKLTAR